MGISTWVVLFAATFYLSLKAARPVPSQLKLAWIGLAVSIFSSAIPAMLELVDLRSAERLASLIDPAVLGVTVIALMLYFQSKS